MPTTDTTVNNLIINKLTKAQYDQIQNPSDTELYLVPDVIDSAPTSGSTNCVESGGVYTALQDKLDAPSTAGTSGQVLTSDGQGGQSWQTPQSGGGGTATDVQVNGTSITSNNVANIVTNTAYNASSNKIATMSDLPSVPVTDVTVGGTSVVSSGVAAVPAIPTVPTISTNVATDKADNTKTTGAKAVYDEVHPPLASTMPSGGFLPNIEYNLGTLNADTTFLMAAATDNTIGNTWYWVFETPSTTLNITFPSSIEWNGGNPPTIDPSKHYEITVKYNVGAFIVTDIPS